MSDKRFGKILSSLMLRGLGSGIAVLFTITVSRYLDTASAAKFFLLFNISTIAAICFRWGLDEIIIRRVASSSAVEIQELARHMVRISHSRVLIWLMGSGAISLAFIHPYTRSTFYDLKPHELLMALFAASLVALTACAARVQQGMGNTNYALFFLNIFVPFFTLSGFLAVVAAGLTIDAPILVLLYGGVASTAYFLVVSMRYGWPVAILRLQNTLNYKSDTLLDSRAANKLGGVVLAQQALNWSAMLTVPAVYGDAVYNGFIVTQKMALLVSLVMLAVNFTFSSRFAALYAARNLFELRRIVRFSLVAILGASVVAALAVFLSRNIIFEFARIEVRMSTVLAILLLSQIFFALASLYSVVLSMCIDDNFLLLAQTVSSLVGVILFLCMSYFLNIELACTAFVASYFFLSLTLGIRVIRITS